MAAADHGEPASDLYQLLGVARDATGEEIAQAWRRRARAEHPDVRPRDAAAPARFRALVQAYQVLGDPARRAAYDRIAAAGRRPSPRAAHITIPVRRLAGAGEPGGLLRMPGPPVQAGPVRVEAHPAPPAGSWGRPEDRLSVLAELALQLLARDQSRP